VFRKIMVPIDLTHVEQLEKALAAAADLSNHYAAPVCFVGVSAATPGPIAHNPHEFERKLELFAEAQAAERGIVEASARSYVTHDPAVDLGRTLLLAVEETGADLVVMQSHVPGFPEHLFASNAGQVAAHSNVSVFVLR
jgi:nucleotide-binding universal stress UspA family protein